MHLEVYTEQGQLVMSKILGTSDGIAELEHVPQRAQLVVRDALGRVVHRQQVTSHYTTWSLDCGGVYLVELVRDGRTMETQRLILQP